MKTLYFLMVVIFVCGLSAEMKAQDRNLDRLEMLYDQGHYKMVKNRSERLAKQDKYAQHPLPKLYSSLSVLRRSVKKGRYEKDWEDSFGAFKQFRALDKDGYYYTAHEHEIYEYQMIIYERIVDLYKNNKKESAEKIYKSTSGLFLQTLSYEVLVRQTEVIKKDPEIKKVDDKETITMNRRDSILEFGKQYLGVPYKWAGTDPSGFDCSGFTLYVMKHFGYNLYRIAGDQYYKNCKKIPVNEAQKGDLVFFGPSADKVTHVGIVSSEKGKPLAMIHAGSSTGITISDVENNSYWKPLLLFTGRLVDEQ
jgi:hypothetical protein